MALTAGMRLGPYEILSSLGAGGMGEVYRAADKKLNRDVAIKVLPADVAARSRAPGAVLSAKRRCSPSLNHPNIAQIYGLEESNGARALVMELVEGPTLADRIAQRPDSARRGAADRAGRSPKRSKPRTTRASSTAI